MAKLHFVILALLPTSAGAAISSTIPQRSSDWAFSAGVNRFNFSEWIMQAWPDRVPGVSFLFIGTVFHRSLTWWEQSKPWHEYVARCQHMLRQRPRDLGDHAGKDPGRYELATGLLLRSACRSRLPGGTREKSRPAGGTCSQQHAAPYAPPHRLGWMIFPTCGKSRARGICDSRSMRGPRRASSWIRFAPGAIRTAASLRRGAGNPHGNRKTERPSCNPRKDPGTPVHLASSFFSPRAIVSSNILPRPLIIS
jgi:hypothetical protein